MSVVVVVHDPVKSDRMLDALVSELAGKGMPPVVVTGGTVDGLAFSEPPVAIVGAWAADRAIEMAATHTDVAALVLVGDGPGPEAEELLAELHDVAVLSLVDTADRTHLRAVVDGHLASSHEGSRLLPGRLDDPPIAEIAQWLATELVDVGEVRPIEFRSADGWEISGDVRLPSRDEPVPAVVLVHSGRSDRTVYTRLGRLLCRAGLAAVRIDIRGRGASAGRGRFIDFSDDEMRAAHLDVVAALNVAASLPEIDADRLAAVGVAHGAGFAADAAVADERVRALVLLTGIPRIDGMPRRVAAGDLALLCVTGRPHRRTAAALRALFDGADRARSRFLEYPEGVLGYQLFELHPDLEPTIVEWLREELA